MNQQEFKIFITQRWDQFKTGSLEDKMNNWMKEVAQERSSNTLQAFPVIDDISTHQVSDGNTMVVVVFRIEYDEVMNESKQTDNQT
ncbi:uncharacterized protein METZ01_LOCUS123028 [marine metagenome]|uniref:Uncharacterized protein n=1 Tax=marine metagenome TaxID=408172 RepID=A0A381XZI3_9ZZZZ|tara:strand:+ start:96 stop:353 length:258 start_codon:yes stop_codon:yes gene_type:complete